MPSGTAPTCECIGANPPITILQWVYCVLQQINLNTNGSGGPLQVSEIGEANFLVTRGTANAGGTSTLAARATRRAVSIYCNPTSPEAVYFGATTGVTTATGAQLNAGQGQVVDTIAALFLCSAAGTGTYTLVEEYD